MKPSGPLVRRKPLVRRAPLKPGTKRMKQRRRAIGNPTAVQQAHQDAQRAHGCAMCHLLGLSFAGQAPDWSPCGPTRVHHRTTGDLHGNPQLGQDETVGLGDYHHQGIPIGVVENGRSRFLTDDEMRERFGPSLQLHKRAFLGVIAERLGERSTAALQRWQDAQLNAAAARAF